MHSCTSLSRLFNNVTASHFFRKLFSNVDLPYLKLIRTFIVNVQLNYESSCSQDGFLGTCLALGRLEINMLRGIKGEDLFVNGKVMVYFETIQALCIACGQKSSRNTSSA